MAMAKTSANWTIAIAEANPGKRLPLKNAWLKTHMPSVGELNAGPPSVNTKISSNPVIVPMIASRTLIVMLGARSGMVKLLNALLVWVRWRAI